MWSASFFACASGLSPSEAIMSAFTLSTCRVALELPLDAHRVGERAGDLASRSWCGSPPAISWALTAIFGLPIAALSSSMAATSCLIAAVRGFERADDLGFRHLLGAGFHHHDAVLRAGDDQVEQALLALGVGRVDDELVVDQADAHAGDGLLERNLRDGQRRRGAGDGEHVGVVVGVGRHDHRDDLRLVAPAGGEERPDRAVDQPAGEHFLFGRLALALEEAAGDASRGVGVFAVVHRERAESRRRAGWRRATPPRAPSCRPSGRSTEPCACLASLPVSIEMVREPTRISRRCRFTLCISIPWVGVESNAYLRIPRRLIRSA